MTDLLWGLETKSVILYHNITYDNMYYQMQFIFHCEKYETLNEVEHFRPKAKVGDSAGNVEHWYWFLAFNPTNGTVNLT